MATTFNAFTRATITHCNGVRRINWRGQWVSLRRRISKVLMLSRQVAPVFRLLHPTDQLFDFSRRVGADFLNKRHNLRVSFGQALRRRLCENEFASFAFDGR
jgi:hypothetical protein